jgi:glycosyltransferase involved in cell wall biosynthesis
MQQGSRQYIVMLGTSTATKGGVAAVIRNYFNAGLAQRWPVVHLPTHCDGGWFAKFRLALTALVHFVPLLAAGRVAIVHVHSASDASFFRKSSFIVLALLARRPIIFHLHGGGFMEFYRHRCGPVRRAIVRFILGRAARIVTLSEGWARKVATITPNRRIVVVPNMVDAAPLLCSDREPTASRRILYLARLEKPKGIYDLLPAFAEARRRCPAATLVLAGDGEVDEVQRRARELGIADAVEMLGWVGGERKYEALHRAALFVLPSHIENMPVSVLEAMAAGLPVIATPVGAMSELVQDGVNGILVVPGDVRALAGAIERLMNDPERCRTMGEMNRRLVLDKFSAERVVPQLETLYRELWDARVMLPAEAGLEKARTEKQAAVADIGSRRGCKLSGAATGSGRR